MQTKLCISYLEGGIGVFMSLGNFNAISMAAWGWNQNDFLSSHVS